MLKQQRNDFEKPQGNTSVLLQNLWRNRTWGYPYQQRKIQKTWKSKTSEDVEYVLRKQYKTLVDNDNELVHPNKICGKCKGRVSSVLEKDMVISLEVFTFQEHSDNNCSLCDAYQSALMSKTHAKRGRPKRKASGGSLSSESEKSSMTSVSLLRGSPTFKELCEKRYGGRKKPQKNEGAKRKLVLDNDQTETSTSKTIPSASKEVESECSQSSTCCCPQCR